MVNIYCSMKVYIFDHPRSDVVYNFGPVCLSVSMYVWLSDENIRKPWYRKFIFGHVAHLHGLRVKFVYEGYRIKVKIRAVRVQHGVFGCGSSIIVGIRRHACMLASESVIDDVDDDDDDAEWKRLWLEITVFIPSTTRWHSSSVAQWTVQLVYCLIHRFIVYCLVLCFFQSSVFAVLLILATLMLIVIILTLISSWQPHAFKYNILTWDLAVLITNSWASIMFLVQCLHCIWSYDLTAV